MTTNQTRKGMSYLTKKVIETMPESASSEDILLKKAILEKGFYNKAIIKMLTEEVTCKEDLMDCMSKATFYGTTDLLGFHKSVKKLEWIKYPKDRPCENPIIFEVQKEKIIADIIELLFYHPIKERVKLTEEFYVTILNGKTIGSLIHKLPPKLSTFLIEDMKDFFMKQLVFKDKKRHNRETLDKLSKAEFIDTLDFEKTKKNITEYLNSLIAKSEVRIDKKYYDYASLRIIQGARNMRKTSQFQFKDISKQDDFLRKRNLVEHFKPIQIRIKEDELVFNRKLKSLSTLTGSLIASDEFLRAMKKMKTFDNITVLIDKIKDQRQKSKSLSKMHKSKEGIFAYRTRHSSTRKIFKHL